MSVKVQIKDGADNVYPHNSDDWIYIGQGSSVYVNTSLYDELYINAAVYYSSNGGFYDQTSCGLYIPTIMIDDTSESSAKNYTIGFGSTLISENPRLYYPGVECSLVILKTYVKMVSFYWEPENIFSGGPSNTSVTRSALVRVYAR